MNTKFANIIAAVLYALMIHYAYCDFAVANFAYLYKVEYSELNMTRWVLYLLFSVLPFSFYKGAKSISAIMTLFIYLFVYVPFTCNLLTNSYDYTVTITYIPIFFFSMIVFFVSDGYAIGKSLIMKKRHRIPFKSLEILIILIYGFVLVANIHNIRFVNFLSDSSSMYELRAENAEGRGTLTLYCMYWLRNVFIPLLMVTYLNKKSYLKFGLAFFAFFFMYMFDMQKSTFIVPFLVTGAYIGYETHKDYVVKKFHLYIIGLLVVFGVLLTFASSNPLIFGIAFIFLLRTLCIEGLELGIYLDFFKDSDHPFTYYSHVNVINALTGIYPYDDSIGRTVMYDESNANGCFWLMDGIAAAGPIGCIIISLIFVVFKSFYNSIGLKYNVFLCSIILINAIVSMINVSLFTALLSCGFIIFFFIMMFCRLDFLDRKRNDVPNMTTANRQKTKKRKIRRSAHPIVLNSQIIDNRIEKKQIINKLL